MDGRTGGGCPGARSPGRGPQATSSFTRVQSRLHSRALSWLELACEDLTVSAFSCPLLRVCERSTLGEGVEMEGDDDDGEDEESGRQGGGKDEEEDDGGVDGLKETLLLGGR